MICGYVQKNVKIHKLVWYSKYKYQSGYTKDHCRTAELMVISVK